jgi:AraC-type DNA-binding domain-containing proteins
LFPVFAGTGVDLIIHFDTSFCNEEGTLPSAHIFCPQRVTDIAAPGKLNFLAVRFRSGTFRHFCSVSFSELNDKSYSVEDIWGRKGRELIEKLHEEECIHSRINILNDFFVKQFDIHNKKNKIMDTYISHIYNNFEDVTIYSLAEEMNISLRHFERLFKEEFGITAKKFQVSSRFHSTIRELLLSSEKDPLQIALNKGYYDQSHFIKECKSLSGFSPSEILKMKGKKSHFYFQKFIPKI